MLRFLPFLVAPIAPLTEVTLDEFSMKVHSLVSHIRQDLIEQDEAESAPDGSLIPRSELQGRRQSDALASRSSTTSGSTLRGTLIMAETPTEAPSPKVH